MYGKDNLKKLCKTQIFKKLLRGKPHFPATCDERTNVNSSFESTILNCSFFPAKEQIARNVAYLLLNHIPVYICANEASVQQLFN